MKEIAPKESSRYSKIDDPGFHFDEMEVLWNHVICLICTLGTAMCITGTLILVLDHFGLLNWLIL